MNSLPIQQIQDAVSINDYETAKQYINDSYGLSSYFTSNKFENKLFNQLRNGSRYSVQHAKFYFQNIQGFQSVLQRIFMRLFEYHDTIQTIMKLQEFCQFDFYDENHFICNTIICATCTGNFTLFDWIRQNYPPQSHHQNNIQLLEKIQLSFSCSIDACKSNPHTYLYGDHDSVIIKLTQYILDQFPNAFKIPYMFYINNDSQYKLFHHVALSTPSIYLLNYLLDNLDAEDRDLSSEDMSNLFCDFCSTESLESLKTFYHHYPNIDITARNHLAIKNACSNQSFDVVLWLCELNPRYSYSYNHGIIEPIISVNWVPMIPIDNSVETCPICYENECSVKLQNCIHEYCKHCIETYFTRQNSNDIAPRCPCCRTLI